MSLHAAQSTDSQELLGASTPAGIPPLGYVDWDGSTASNERVIMRSPLANRDRIIRDQYVRIEDPLGSRTGFLGRIVAGPFFSPRGAPTSKPYVSLGQGLSGEFVILAEIELQGEFVGGRARSSKSRPISRAIVRELSADEVADMLGFSGDMVMGAISGQEDICFRLQSHNKAVLPRNLGIFGTVGSGKSNTSQVLVEEASANGWAVIVLDVESEYIQMDGPSADQSLLKKLVHYAKEPQGVKDFQVYHPASCASERESSEPFTLRLADFESSIIAEILQASVAERNALLDCIEHLVGRAKTQLATREADALGPLLDPSPQASLPFTLRSMKDRAGERSSRSSESYDYTGLSAKLRQEPGHGGCFAQGVCLQGRPRGRRADPFGDRGSALVRQPRKGADHGRHLADAARRCPSRPQALALSRLRQPAAWPPAARNLRVVQHAHRTHAAEHA